MINCGINSFCGLAKPISSAISFQLNKFINYASSITEKQTFYIVAPLHSTHPKLQYHSSCGCKECSLLLKQLLCEQEIVSEVKGSNPATNMQLQASKILIACGKGSSTLLVVVGFLGVFRFPLAGKVDRVGQDNQ